MRREHAGHSCQEDGIPVNMRADAVRMRPITGQPRESQGRKENRHDQEEGRPERTSRTYRGKTPARTAKPASGRRKQAASSPRKLTGRREAAQSQGVSRHRKRPEQLRPAGLARREMSAHRQSLSLIHRSRRKAVRLQGEGETGNRTRDWPGPCRRWDNAWSDYRKDAEKFFYKSKSTLCVLCGAFISLWMDFRIRHLGIDPEYAHSRRACRYGYNPFISLLRHPHDPA